MKKVYFVILGILLVAASLTNPKQEKHREVVREKLKTTLKTALEKRENQDDQTSQIIQSIGFAYSDILLEPLVKNVIYADNYLLFSITKANWDGKSHAIGFGLFGSVFITQKLENELAEILNEL